MHVTQHVSAIYITHDVLNRSEGIVDVWSIVHRQYDTGYYLQGQTEGKDNAPNPHPVQVLWCRCSQCCVHQTNYWQTAMSPFLTFGFWFIMVVRNSTHCDSPLTQFDRGIIHEYSRWNRQVCRRWTLTDTACSVIV